MRRAALALIAIAALAGCNEEAAPGGIHSPEGVMIRDWLMAVEHYDFSHAADFFAPGAIIDQSGPPYRLRNRRAARLFNATLPCHADLIALSDEGSKVLATFRLRPGPGGDCTGKARVRYTIVDGRFTEWRQLTEPAV
jgi:SnoaL-like domain